METNQFKDGCNAGSETFSKTGFFKTDYGQFPKIQIVTVEQLFGTSNPLHLPWQDTSVFKKAKRETTETQSKLDL